MLFSKKNLRVCVLFTIILLGCGFQPLLNQNQHGEDILNLGMFSFHSPKDAISFKIKEELLKDLGFPQNPTYKILTYSELKSIKSLITSENDITRYNLVLETTLKLISLKNTKEIYNKKFTSQTAYSASKNVTGFATKTAEDSAKNRLATDIAKKIVMELLIIRGDIIH